MIIDITGITDTMDIMEIMKTSLDVAAESVIAATVILGDKRIEV